MTGMWENALSKIETGETDAATFHKGIEVYARQITAELLDVQLSFASGETCPCPKCGNGRILFTLKLPNVQMWIVRLPFPEQMRKGTDG